MRRKNNRHNKMISVKQIMQKYNVTYQTVNHYTDFGLLPVTLKKGNMRFYDKDVVAKRMEKIRELREEGYTLRLVRKKLMGI
ncbi:MAG: helix-turn-helix domain-containing protein [Candidatus Omnitrophica bacterium]|nr:helix-turn-helix domain-containing protein [Candidatus Omnitrophota bacterium]